MSGEITGVVLRVSEVLFLEYVLWQVRSLVVLLDFVRD